MTTDSEWLNRPSPAEQARTTLAVARCGALTTDPRRGSQVLAAVIVHGGEDPVSFSLPADDPASAVLRSGPLSTLRVAPAGFAPTTVQGQVRHLEPADGRGLIRYALGIATVRLGNGGEQPVDVGAVLAAEPDPLREHVAAILDHLQRDHGPDLVSCLRAQGHGQVQWAQARRLDRYGLELTVLDADGVAIVRLDFPQPVACLEDISPGIYLALRGRCRSCRNDDATGSEAAAPDQDDPTRRKGGRP